MIERVFTCCINLGKPLELFDGFLEWFSGHEICSWARSLVHVSKSLKISLQQLIQVLIMVSVRIIQFRFSIRSRRGETLECTKSLWNIKWVIGFFQLSGKGINFTSGSLNLLIKCHPLYSITERDQASLRWECQPSPSDAVIPPEEQNPWNRQDL